ncbi:MAG TPA: DUF3501 family protein, partial [Leptospiraceae bacterium]|jgi:hypothetical protein|nr:DUF3501 family protein [Leptospirales bacterium]HMU81981.1 DUF3501 family protein [Leptospiraceae bacterium]HMW58398.1 DUF3501 family protein [Leptospiraceae bacterium]HMX58014.1 DUF3501 family protein [Leptospiraceae bacterium]HMY43931.1 DUF3501 family protein [Leptospiraceae bacterium]
MKKLEMADVIPNTEYEKIRDSFRSKILRIKEPRRIAVGPYLMFLFENRETMLYQVQEMMRAEGIRAEEAIQHEINTYNELVPGPCELRATLMIEFADEATRRVKLKELVGLEKHVSLVIDRDYVISAVFDEKQMDPDKLSSVQYIHFPLGEKAAEAFLSTNDVELVTTHPACSYRQSISQEQLSSLKEDLYT